MAEYLKLNDKKINFFEVFNDKLLASEQNSGNENHAALSVQRVFRGTRSRERIAKMNYAANEIERIIRGKFGRNRAKAAAKAKRDGRQVSLFNYLCIQLQKSFRGYYSRKYKQDQRRRKRYCATLIEQGDKVRMEMDRYAQEQVEREAIEAQRLKEEEFKSYAKNLHHLVSTKQIRGVYKPAREHLEEPRMGDVPVEDHIRGVVKDLLRTKGISKTGLVFDVNGTKKVPLKGLKYRLSVQASAPYDAVEQEKKREKSLHKILTADKGTFFVGGKTNLINNDPVPMCVGSPYLDSWANPMLVKGVPKDQQQLIDSAIQQKALFATKPEKPFVSLVGGNRSTTLPNDVFDVIAEAQETGGAIQRHLGTTTMRFGLPQSADNRYDGTIPAPPIRASCTVKSTRPQIRSFALDIKARTAGSLPFQREDKFEDEASQQISLNADSSDDEQ